MAGEAPSSGVVGQFPPPPPQILALLTCRRKRRRWPAPPAVSPPRCPGPPAARGRCGPRTCPGFSAWSSGWAEGGARRGGERGCWPREAALPLVSETMQPPQRTQRGSPTSPRPWCWWGTHREEPGAQQGEVAGQKPRHQGPEGGEQHLPGHPHHRRADQGGVLELGLVEDTVRALLPWRTSPLGRDLGCFRAQAGS